MTLQNNYFIALIPPQDICDEIDVFKTDFKLNYNSKAALKTVPHITLKAPFKMAADLHSHVMQWFTNLKTQTGSFDITLKDFGFFDNLKNPVVYVQPLKDDALTQLQAAVIKDFETAFPHLPVHYHEHAFNPHITIAYRDLTYTEFEKAKLVYATKKYDAAFKAEHLYLLQHDGTHWNVIARNSL